MKASAGKRYKKRHKVLSAIFISNPALVLGFDLPFLIATSTSLKNAVVMSIELLFIHTITMMISVIFARKLSKWLRSIITVAVSTATMILTRELIILMFPDITNTLGMYLYLLSVNGLTLVQSLSLNRRSKPIPILKRELFHVLAFALTMFSLSFVREYLGGGTLWGIVVPSQYKMGGLLIPFSGFIIMGFMLAIVKYFNRNFLGLAINESYRRENRYVIQK